MDDETTLDSFPFDMDHKDDDNTPSSVNLRDLPCVYNNNADPKAQKEAEVAAPKRWATSFGCCKSSTSCPLPVCRKSEASR